MGHIHVYARQDRVYMRQAACCLNYHRPYKQNSQQYHYSLDQGGHTDGVQPSQDGVAHNDDGTYHQSPLIRYLEEPGQDHADGDVLPHQIDYGDENADYGGSTSNALRAVEPVGEIILHRH